MSSLAQRLFSSEDLYPGEVVLRAEGLSRSYFRGKSVPVLQGASIELKRGEFVSVIGSSGSGKSTLLHLLGALDRPDEGKVFYRKDRIDDQPKGILDRYRNETVGFIFQFYHLLPELTALENVMLPAMIRLSPLKYWSERNRIRQHAKELLFRVGLEHRFFHRPSELSGGEMQRAAIARALLARPKILLADEPTGNLDQETGSSILDLLRELNREIHLTILLVTHDRDLASTCHRTLKLVGGQLEPVLTN